MRTQKQNDKSEHILKERIAKTMEKIACKIEKSISIKNIGNTQKTKVENNPEIELNILITKEDELFIAYSLEFGLVADGRTIEEAQQYLFDIIKEQVKVCIENNKTDTLLFQAPEEYWQKFWDCEGELNHNKKVKLKLFENKDSDKGLESIISNGERIHTIKILGDSEEAKISEPVILSILRKFEIDPEEFWKNEKD